MFAPFRTGRSNLLWRGVFLVLLVQATLASSNTLGTASEAQDDLDEKIVQDLKSERVNFFFRIMKSRLVVLVSHAPVAGFLDEDGWSTTSADQSVTATTVSSVPVQIVPSPDDYYVYDMPSSAFTPTGKLYLHGGVLFKDKWPSLHDWLVNPANSFKSEPGDWLQDYAYMFVTDEQQHEYLRVVMIERPTSEYHRYNVADNFLIDKTGGSSEQVKNMTAHLTEELKVMICSNEPMSFYYLNMQDGDSRQTILYRQGDSSQGDPRRNFALGKRAFNGSTSLAESTGFTNVGQIYAICKSGESEIVTQEARAQLCNETVDWDIWLVFVDSADRLVLLDEHMTMRFFPRSALTPVGVGKPVQVETKLRGQFLEKGLPPSPDSNNQSRGDNASMIMLIFSLIIIGRALSIQFLHRCLLCLSAFILLMHSVSASNNTTSSTASSSPIDYDSDEYEDATKLTVKKSNKIIFIIAIPVIIIFFIVCILTEYYFGITFVYVQFCVRQNERKAKKKNNKKFIKKDRKENEELKTDGSLALQTIGGTTGSTSIESSAIARKRRDSE